MPKMLAKMVHRYASMRARAARDVVRALAAAWGCTALLGCPDGVVEDAGVLDAGPTPVFPTDFAGEWRETRDCRFTHEHGLRYIRVLADEQAYPVYTRWNRPYPEGATLVKLEYDDEDCTELLGFTAMRKLAPGAFPEGYDWHWQELDAEFKVLRDGAPIRCLDCHSFHCPEPCQGFDFTCAEELPDGTRLSPNQACQ